MSRQLREMEVQTACLAIIAAVAIAGALYWLKVVMVPFVIAFFLALLGGPIIDFAVTRLRIPQLLIVMLTVILGFASFATVGGAVSVSVAQFASNASIYTAQVQVLLDRAMKYEIWQRFGMDPAKNLDVDSLLPEQIIADMLNDMAGTIASLMSSGVLVTLFVFFILLRRPIRKQKLGGVAGRIESDVKRYIATKFLVSLTTGVLVFATLRILDVNFAVTFGAFAFLLNFIPNIGSIIATLLPIPVVFFSADIPISTALLAVAIPGCIQFTLGNIIEPKLMGDTLDMHPVMVLLSLIFWGVMWGMAGMFLAVPLTAIVKIVLERIEVTRPAAEMMAGRFDKLSSDETT